MSKILSKGLTFDDVLLVPAYSEVTPDVVDVTAWLTPSISLNIPLVSAAMDTVTESAMAISMARAGGIGIVHKNMSIERQKLEIEKVKKSESGMIIDPITVEPDDTVEHALDLMHAYRVSGLPVVREKKLVGILTNRDVRFVEDLAGTKVRDVMTSENLITVPTGTTLEEAKHHLHTHRIEKLLVVDEKGELIDGDKILAIFSKYMKNMGILKNNTCVVTVMTNLGFFKYAKANGIVAATTKVGDRYVLEEMLKGGYNIGGEQSGHIILLDYANTGDGELTGTKLLTVLKCTGEKASELASCMECYPQVLVNVKITADKKGMWDKVPEITDAIKMYSEKLGDEGRILVRESGTEPLVRVMIEGKRTGIITEYAHKIAELIEKM